MSHIPLGYYIKDGKPYADDIKALQINTLFKNYISGMGLIDAASSVGFKMTHSSVKRLLMNKHYLGDEYYPQIIDEELFLQAKEERERRAEFLNRNNLVKEQKIINIPTLFHWKDGIEHYDNPYEQAQYLYGLIESEG